MMVNQYNGIICGISGDRTIGTSFDFCQNDLFGLQQKRIIATNFENQTAFWSLGQRSHVNTKSEEISFEIIKKWIEECENYESLIIFKTMTYIHLLNNKKSSKTSKLKICFDHPKSRSELPEGGCFREFYIPKSPVNDTSLDANLLTNLFETLLTKYLL